jgi:hypothetical protein
VKRKVSLIWLANSKDLVAYEFRERLASQAKTGDCFFCDAFFEEEGAEFDDLNNDTLDHFQQVADLFGISVEIVSLFGEKEPKEIVSFT